MSSGRANTAPVAVGGGGFTPPATVGKQTVDVGLTEAPERTSPTRSRAYANKGSSFNMAYGRRSVKAYPVTDVDLNSLGTMSLLCTLAFSAGTGLAGIAFDITASLSMSAGVDPGTEGFWSGIQLFSALGAVVLWVIGGGIYLRRRAHIGNIKRETDFD